ncbi:MAG: internalization-related competence protein ComEC/Rec2 [Bacillales bacterium]|jgi:competence protein ComEC|nr:internalization-related competence protein ComEC/Rec2 [Bacillales bacterium]
MEEKLIFFCAFFCVIGTVTGLQFEWYLVGLFCIFIILLKKRFTWFQLALFAFFFMTFFLNAILAEQLNNSILKGNEISLEIGFRKSPNIDGDSFSGFATDIESGERIWLSYKIQTEDEKMILEKNCLVGEVFKVNGKLKHPKHDTVENGFDFHDYLKRNNTHWVLNAQQLNHLRTENSISAKILQVREKAILKIKSTFPDPLMSYTIALIFGDQKQIDENAYRAYQKLGIVHLFSISGAQVGFIVWLLYTGLVRLGISQKWSMVIVIVMIPFYAGLTGFSPSVNRACGMVIILFISRLLRKRISPLICLCLCMILYLLIQPYQLYSIGFQLSFSICCGLILSQKILGREDRNPVSQIFIGTLICQVSSLPILMVHFYEVSLLGFLSNLIYIPLFSFFFFPMTIIIYFLHLMMGNLFHSFLRIGNFLFQELYDFSKLLSNTPFSSICFGKPSTIFMLLICFGVFFVLFSLEQNKPKQVITSFFVLFTILLLQFNSNFISSNGEVTFIDVGQGDSIFIRLPHNAGNYLIDTGGIFSIQKESWQEKVSKFDPGKDVILPFLRSKGIRKLDKLILTHADFDHIGGSKAIFENLEVEHLLIPTGQNEEFNKYEWFNQKKIDLIQQIVKTGVRWKIGDNFFEVIHPETTSGDKNSSSIVLIAKINGVNFLFTGDADLVAEEEILSKYALQVDVLKAGHHGSDTSTGKTFLERIRPNVSIISVGENNRYGHPSSEVIDRLKENRVHILRTDTQGSVKFNIKNGTFTTFPPYHKAQ